MKRIFRVALLAALVVPALAAPALAAPPPVHFHVTLDCLEGGGAYVTFTIHNEGRHKLFIDQDFHVQLELVQPEGEPSGIIAFVFPAPSFSRIGPGKTRTFGIPMGEGFDGEPGIDLSAHRLALSAEVFWVGRRATTEDRFTFPGCPPP